MATRAQTNKTKTRDRNICELYQSGMTRRQVAQRLKINPSTVNRVLAVRGVLREDDERGSGISVQRYEEAHARVATVAHLVKSAPHTTAEDLSAAIGVCAATVRRHLVEMGKTLRRGPGPIKLTEEVVAAIKADLVEGRLSFNDLGRKYSITKSSIAGIAMDRQWQHVPWPRPYVRRPVGARPAADQLERKARSNRKK